MNNQPAQPTSIPQTPPIPVGEHLTPPATAELPKPPRRKIIFLALGSLILTAVLVGSLIGFYFLRKPKAPSWNNLKPGVSTREDVIKVMGTPLKEQQLPYSLALFYPSDYEVFPNTIVLDQEDKVKSILIQVPPDEEIKLSGWIKQYDNPEKEMWNTYSAETKTYLFPKKGTVVVASEVADRILAIHYFIPMSLADYLSTWGQNLFEENPYEM